MEILHNGFTLEFSEGAFPLSTDTIALSGFVNLHKNDKVLDLGSGCGSIGHLLCARDPDCQITGIELDRKAHEMALKNASANGISSRFHSICSDMNHISQFIAPGSFSLCVSNPPYFSAGPQSQKTPLARREDCCTMSDLFRAAAWGLKYGGSFYLVHRPERLAELCATGSRHQLEPKRLCLLHHRSDGPITLLLMECRKGGKPGLILEEESLFDSRGEPTDYYRKLYHLGG